MNYGFENNQFYVEFPALTRVPGNMREESDRRAREIAESGSRLILSMSSGVDSQSVLHSFYTQGIPIECVFYYMPGYNEIEYQQLQQVKKKYPVKIDIIDLDPLKYEEQVMITAKEQAIHPIQIMQGIFTSLLPDDADVIQMIHDPFVHITKSEKFYFYQGYCSPEVARMRLMELLNRKGKYIPYGDPSEFVYSILNDDVYKSAMYTHQYFDGNGLYKENFHLDSVDRWDYYIKPIIYGKYWKDELIYFPKYGGWEHVPFMKNDPSDPALKIPDAEVPNYRVKPVLIPYFEFIKELEQSKVPLRYYQRQD
jgi:hypothetical protein